MIAMKKRRLSQGMRNMDRKILEKKAKDMAERLSKIHSYWWKWELLDYRENEPELYDEVVRLLSQDK